MTPEKLREGRRVLADALGTDAMPVTARERDLAQSEYRVWVANNLRELLDVAEEAARMKEDRKRLINSLAEAWEERDALRKQLEEADSLLRELHIRLHAFGRRSTECWELSEIESYIARHVGKRWTREGPAGRCKVCNGTGILPAREGD